MNKYYNLKEILSKNADYNIIIGERSNGKTYSVLRYILERYAEKKEQGAYIRRWQDDIIGKRAESVFSSLVENNEVSKITKGEYSNIIYNRGKYYLANWNDDKKRMIADTTPFCFNFALSTGEHDKSTSYPNVMNIVFDEFITRRFYLPDEFILFMNTLSTIIRDREHIKIFMLGNTVNKFSPYFEEMGLTNITTQEQGTIDLYSYGDSGLTVAVEYCDNLNKKKKSNKYFAFNNSKLNMIKNGQWELSLYPHLAQGEKIYSNEILYSFYVCFTNKIIQGDIIQKPNGLFIYFHKKTTEIKDIEKSLIFSLSEKTKLNYRKSLLNGFSKIDKMIAFLFTNDKVFYQSNEIGELVNNYIMQTTRGIK